MSNTRLQSFRSFLTERLTSVAVEIFGEVETIAEAYYEENKRLRNILHMVLSPEIKLHRIDDDTKATTDAREQPAELYTGANRVVSQHLPKKPKEEHVEYEIGLGSDPCHQLFGINNTATTGFVKTEPKVEDVNMFSTPDSKASVSDEEMNHKHEGGSLLDSNATTDPSQLSSSEESGSESMETLKCNDTPETKKPKDLQKTMLELPRMVPLKPLTAPTDSQSFLARLTEAYKDLPDDQKPMITKMGLTADVEFVDCAFGEVPKGCPLSYQCPAPSLRDYKILVDAPSRPLLPMSFYRLEPVSRLPNLSAQQQEHVTVMQITWDAAHILELSTRECKEPAEELCKLRLTSRFKQICKLKPGQDHAERLISKMHSGFPRCKSSLIEKNMKTEALREYCRHLCVNWYPCGLVVHPNAPWLGALPDGLVYDPNETPAFGLVHVKCITTRSFVDCRFLVCQDGILKLNTGHPYYWHIQGEMIVTGTSWCDLFVISTDDMLVQRIYRDKSLMKYMMTKLHNFFFCYYLRSLFSTGVTS